MVGCIYGIIVAMFVYKELTFRKLIDIFVDNASVVGIIFLTFGVANSLSFLVSFTQLPTALSDMMGAISQNKYVILAIINVFLLVIGCFVDNIAAVIILTPILLPVVKMIGIDPIHFGLIITVNLACGFISPPYGINLFVASAISGESIENISREIIPAFVAMVGCLLIFTYFPVFSMGLLQIMR